MAEKYKNNLLGIISAVIASFLVVLMGAIGKKLGGELSPFVVVFLYSLFSFIAFLPVLAKRGGAQIRSQVPGLQALRAFVFALALVMWFWALPKIALADMTAIGYSSSLFTLVGAILFLGEASKLWRWTVLAVGVAGMLVILKPGFSEVSFAMVVIIAVSAAMALARLINKVVTRRDNPIGLVFWHGALTTIYTLPTAIIYWQSPTNEQWIWLILLGALGAIQQLFSAWSIKYADFGIIEPANFLKLVWAAGLGFAIFGEIPSITTIIGGIVIVGSVIYVAKRERRDARDLVLPTPL
ncbi:MAG: DMT family transporter [Rhodospirillales bacterium]|nr:DMT family transporter [Rhodospirillales bacterium]